MWVKVVTFCGDCVSSYILVGDAFSSVKQALNSYEFFILKDSCLVNDLFESSFSENAVRPLETCETKEFDLSIYFRFAGELRIAGLLVLYGEFSFESMFINIFIILY